MLCNMILRVNLTSRSTLASNHTSLHHQPECRHLSKPFHIPQPTPKPRTLHTRVPRSEIFRIGEPAVVGYGHSEMVSW
ncbi:hypothetical protein BJX68DRAFT_223644 [Aspergillus pseudodeflectus]|uniref:Uncharacterized protein n=1 Tax=Aspergillus pseudodeflectus TaxID=176178 RepID=A0ABR4LBV5_9EURO